MTMFKLAVKAASIAQQSNQTFQFDKFKPLSNSLMDTAEDIAKTLGVNGVNYSDFFKQLGFTNLATINEEALESPSKASYYKVDCHGCGQCEYVPLKQGSLPEHWRSQNFKMKEVRFITTMKMPSFECRKCRSIVLPSLDDVDFNFLIESVTKEASIGTGQIYERFENNMIISLLVLKSLLASSMKEQVNRVMSEYVRIENGYANGDDDRWYDTTCHHGFPCKDTCTLGCGEY